MTKRKIPLFCQNQLNLFLLFSKTLERLFSVVFGKTMESLFFAVFRKTVEFKRDFSRFQWKRRAFFFCRSHLHVLFISAIIGKRCIDILSDNSFNKCFTYYLALIWVNIIPCNVSRKLRSARIGSTTRRGMVKSDNTAWRGYSISLTIYRCRPCMYVYVGPLRGPCVCQLISLRLLPPKDYLH